VQVPLLGRERQDDLDVELDHWWAPLVLILPGQSTAPVEGCRLVAAPSPGRGSRALVMDLRLVMIGSRTIAPQLTRITAGVSHDE